MAEKMIIIPADMWEREKMERKHLQEPIIHPLDAIRRNITEAMDDVAISDYDKEKLLIYLQQRYKRILANHSQEDVKMRNEYENNDIKNPPDNIQAKEKVDSYSPEDKGGTDDVMKHVIGHMPTRKMKFQAKKILTIMKTEDSSIGWDKDHHLVVNGKAMDGTNITDIVGDIVGNEKGRHKKKNHPTGAELFITHLKSLNKGPYNNTSPPRTRSLSKKPSSKSGQAWKERSFIN